MTRRYGELVTAESPGELRCNGLTFADKTAGGRQAPGLSMLSSDELERYARHIVLHEVGGPGQAALKRARVLVVGAGGLGAPVFILRQQVSVPSAWSTMTWSHCPTCIAR